MREVKDEGSFVETTTKKKTVNGSKQRSCKNLKTLFFLFFFKKKHKHTTQKKQKKCGKLRKKFSPQPPAFLMESRTQVQKWADKQGCAILAYLLASAKRPVESQNLTAVHLSKKKSANQITFFQTNKPGDDGSWEEGQQYLLSTITSKKICQPLGVRPLLS